MKKREKREKALLELLAIHERLEVRAVCEALDISEATARRLFQELAEDGKLIRIHGGIQTLPSGAGGYSYSSESMKRKCEKTAIGKAAAKDVRNDEKLFLDSGTTVLRLGEALAARFRTGGLARLTVLTNSYTIVETLAPWCRVILIGGEARLERRDVCGSLAEKALAAFHLDNVFLGADAIHERHGFMTTDEQTARMNEIVIAHAARTTVLADSTKFRQISFVTYAELRQVDRLITDAGLSAEDARTFGAHLSVVRV